MSESSVRARRSLVRGTASLRQVEVMHMIRSAALSLLERTGKHFEGTHKGTGNARSRRSRAVGNGVSRGLRRAERGRR